MNYLYLTTALLITNVMYLINRMVLDIPLPLTCILIILGLVAHHILYKIFDK